MELPILVERVTFRNPNGFAVMACNLDPYSKLYTADLEDLVKDCINKKYNSFTVTTGILDINENPAGGQYVVCGEFTQDKKFGRQFKADFYYQDEPSTEDGVKAFLVSLPNIKEARSDAIIEKYGVQGTIDILNTDIYRLTEIAGITPKRIPAIQKTWDEKKHMRELYGFFTKHKVQIGIANIAYKEWAQKALEIIQENPYRLVELRGISFKTADLVAHQIKSDVSNDYRVTACLKFILDDAYLRHSNLCLPYSTLKKNLELVLLECDKNLGKNVDGEVYKGLIASCLKSNLELFTIVKDKSTDTIYVYLSHVWRKEYYITKSIYDRKVFNHAKKDISDKDIEGAEQDISSFCQKKIVLDDCQKDAIKSAFEHKITVITGAGGTGKSAICRCIFSIAQKKNLTIRMMSPTGKAAQVLAEKTNCGTATIHRGLKLQPGDDKPREEIREDILLIDEISMCGLDTMYAIMYALEGNKWANIVLVGDKNQLPSVSPGNFLSDIIDSGCANVVTLNKIHRQDEKSYISYLANEISKGKVVAIPDDATDLHWHKLNADTLNDELSAFLDKYLNDCKDIFDLQFMSPMKKGMCGVYAINTLIQEKMAKFNRTELDILTIGFNKYYRGDRVIQIENNYDKDVFNGDMGVITDLGEKVIDASENDKKERFITVEYGGKKITYLGNEIDQLQLAWTLTVHKFQGSQCKNIVFIMASEASIMMSKELVYTAFTRSEKQLDIFGHENMLRLAPTKSAISKRFTNMSKIIEELKGTHKVLDIIEKKTESED